MSYKVFMSAFILSVSIVGAATLFVMAISPVEPPVHTETKVFKSVDEALYYQIDCMSKSGGQTQTVTILDDIEITCTWDK